MFSNFQLQLQHCREKSKQMGEVMEIASKIESINKLEDNLLDKPRYLIFQGYLTQHSLFASQEKGGESAKNELYYFLLNDTLLSTIKRVKMFSETYRLIDATPLDLLSVSPTPPSFGVPHGITLSVEDKEMVVSAPSAKEGKLWMDNLQSYISLTLQNKLIQNKLRQKKVFGVSLEDLMSRESEFGRFQPTIVEKLIQQFYRNDGSNLKVCGVFRINGSAHEIRNIAECIDSGKDIQFSCVDIHVVAGLLKHWLRTLPEPLLTYELFEDFMHICAKEAADTSKRNSSQRDQSLKNVQLAGLVGCLPPYNRFVLHSIVNLLYDIDQQSESNKMHISSLAIVFGPNLIRPPVEEVEGMEYFKQVPNYCNVVKLLVEHKDVVFAGI
eukprot:CAMPEP_0174266536 /NCGR_PEP_ID=MMETSP0439-20130205/30584_1 /TAXON_ID=0 /ORGANISM="Stereomyxa ramosa, Strain Chinc5" /LENGTH=382 /DNA_ID=CAMNT_0015353567 /DNA_START=519 /DNA_END=1664 /DNA_ORIENTATION=-